MIKIIKKDIDELIPYENNARINDAAIDVVANSINDFGFKNPCIIDKNNVLIAGHTRVAACKKLGIKEIPCIVADDLTDEQIKAFRIADNSSAQVAEWDMDKLMAELQDIDYDMAKYGLAEQMEQIAEQIANSGEVQEDDFEPELPEEPKARLGDIYQLGNHRLMCGDSTKEEDVANLMDGAKADMVFTDPPFPNNSNIMQDMIKNIEKAFINARNVCAGVSMWFWDNLEFPPFNEKVTAKYIWHKTNGWQTNHFEEIYVFHNDNVRHEQIVFSECNVGVDNKRNKMGNHPTPKPIKLFCNIVHTIGLNGNKVLDLFGGSGSTLIACEQLGRKCYMMELDPKYVDVIITRWEQFTGKKAIKIN